MHRSVFTIRIGFSEFLNLADHAHAALTDFCVAMTLPVLIDRFADDVLQNCAITVLLGTIVAVFLVLE